MYKIRILGTQINTGFQTVIETLSKTDVSEQSVVDLFETDNYNVIALEVEKLDDE